MARGQRPHRQGPPRICAIPSKRIRNRAECTAGPRTSVAIRTAIASSTLVTGGRPSRCRASHRPSLKIPFDPRHGRYGHPGEIPEPAGRRKP